MWKLLKDLPTGLAFTEVFAVREEKPPRGRKQIVAFVRLITKVLVNDIKFDTMVFAYLRRENVYVRVDHFETQQIGSPWFVIKVHPNLTRKEIFMEEIVSELENTKRLSTAVVKDWMRKYGECYSTEEGRNPVPAFMVNVGNRKFGQGSTQVQTSALIYTCAIKMRNI